MHQIKRLSHCEIQIEFKFLIENDSINFRHSQISKGGHSTRKRNVKSTNCEKTRDELPSPHLTSIPYTQRSTRSPFLTNAKQKSSQLLSTNPPNRHSQSNTLSPWTENENDIIKNPPAFKITFIFLMGENARTIQGQRSRYNSI